MKSPDPTFRRPKRHHVNNLETYMTPQEIAAAAARLVRDGVSDAPTALEHVAAEARGRDLAARINAQRGQNQPKTEEKPK